MLAVLDTNVLVSALLSPFGPPADILRLVVTGKLRLCVDTRILSEYSGVLARPKFDLSPALVESLLDFIRGDSLVITAIPSGIVLPDPGDSPFLDVAITAKAKALITGNLKHFKTPRPIPGLDILNPTAFLATYHKRAE